MVSSKNTEGWSTGDLLPDDFRWLPNGNGEYEIIPECVEKNKDASRQPLLIPTRDPLPLTP
jgi:hypothetical protein